MEISEVRKRVREAMDRAKRAAVERRTRVDEAEREYQMFMAATAVPLFRQIANVLRADGYPFTVFTPGGSVRLMSDRSRDDYIEILMDTAGSMPRVIGHTSRSRGGEVVETEGAIGQGGTVREISEEELLGFILKALEPFVDR